MLAFDFGTAAPAEGFRKVGLDTSYDAEVGYGWLERTTGVVRDRGVFAAPLGDFVMGFRPAVFRIRTGPARQRVVMSFGDTFSADHEVCIAFRDARSQAIAEIGPVRPRLFDFAELSFCVQPADGHVDLTFRSTASNWIVCSVVLEPMQTYAPPRSRIRRLQPSRWDESVLAEPGPYDAMAAFRRENEGSDRILSLTKTAALRMASYRDMAAGIVDYFVSRQDAGGAIIDPVKGLEWQYATPCFAGAAAFLAAEGGRQDLVEPALRALELSCRYLAQREAPQQHEDFFVPSVALALRRLAGLVPGPRLDRCQAQIAGLDPFTTYRIPAGGVEAPGTNWNTVAACGEYILFRDGVRRSAEFSENSVAGQGRHFDNAFGLYNEGPMPYDLFARLWLSLMLHAGYAGRDHQALAAFLRRGAVTGLFLQAASGEAPIGGRSSHHQWNEAQQCIIFEVFADRAQALEKDDWLAGVFTRAARRSLERLVPWRRPSGELYIVRNRFEPASRQGYESYTSHSQYNLQTAFMMTLAHDVARQAKDVVEQVTPAEAGRFSLCLPPPFNKRFFGFAGSSVQLQLAPEAGQAVIGINRYARRGFEAEGLIPDALVGSANYIVSPYIKRSTALSLFWREHANAMRGLPLLGLDDADVTCAEPVLGPAEGRVVQRYALRFGEILEAVTLTAEGLELNYTYPQDAADGWCIRFPLVVEDGLLAREVTLAADRLELRDARQCMTIVPVNGDFSLVSEGPVGHRNGLARVFEIASRGGGTVGLRLAGTLLPGSGQ